jgi:hypothetical protein
VSIRLECGKTHCASVSGFWRDRPVGSGEGKDVPEAAVAPFEALSWHIVGETKESEPGH